MTEFLTQFHFLRPLWLLALPCALWFIAWHSQRSASAGWGRHVAKDKLPHLVMHPSHSSLRRRGWLALAATVACIALAGPSWESIPNTLAGNRQATVILFDLSPSMLASDIKPNRLQHARLKLIDLLQRRTDGETALIAYAGDAHRVSPLTDDPATIVALGHTLHLHPDIMPVAGSQTETAIELALTLFAGADLQQGDILLISDGLHNDAIDHIKNTLPRGFRLSILGVGTAQGAPIPTTEAGFLYNANQQIVIAALDEPPLRALAEHFAGRYHRVSVDNQDVDYLSELADLPFSARIRRDVQQFDKQHDAGYWLVLLLLPVAALSFRRHLIWVALPVILVSPDSQALDWADLWLTRDQQAARALQQGDVERAATLFEDARWRGVAHYRNEAYREAVQQLSNASTADDFYNLANAIAMAGDLEQAVKAYDQALALNPEHEDALFNRALLQDSLTKEAEMSAEEDQRSGGSGDSEGSTEAQDTTSVQPVSAGQQERTNPKTPTPHRTRRRCSNTVATAAAN